MPFKSKAQLAWMKENRPDLFEEFMSKTKDVEKLPERIKEKKPIRYSGNKDTAKGKAKSKKGTKK